jgi:hypothetical protein
MLERTGWRGYRLSTGLLKFGFRVGFTRLLDSMSDVERGLNGRSLRRSPCVPLRLVPFGANAHGSMTPACTAIGQRIWLYSSSVVPEACVDRYAEQQAARMAAVRRMYHQDLGPSCASATCARWARTWRTDTRADQRHGLNGIQRHRANILNSSYRLLGVGAAQSSDGRWYAAQVFGA